MVLWCASSFGLLWARKRKKVAHYFNYDLMHRLAGGRQMTDVWRMPAIAPWEKTCGFIGDDGVRCSAAPQANARYCEKHMPRDENDAEDCTEVELASCWPT